MTPGRVQEPLSLREQEVLTALGGHAPAALEAASTVSTPMSPATSALRSFIGRERERELAQRRPVTARARLASPP